MNLPSDDRQVIADLERHLARYRPLCFDAFVRLDQQGACYSLERDDGYSVVNTATLLRLAKDYPSMLSTTLDRTAAEAKLRKELDDAVQKMKSNTARPDLAEYDAYRAAQIVRAIDDSGAQQALTDWLIGCVQQWITQKGTYEPSVFVLFLAIDGVGGGLEREGLLRTALELLLSRQVILAREANGYFDAIDVALLLAMIEPAQIEIGQMNAAVKALHDTALDRGIWTNRRPVARTGRKTIGCSAIEACAALLVKRDSPLYRTLRTPLMVHLQWLTNQDARDGLWFRSDLLRNERVHETWFNCRVLDFLHRFRARAQAELRTELLSRYRARTVETSYGWANMLLDPGDSTALQDGLIAPAKKNSPPAKLEQCTAILFGPPGTTKTTIAETLANEVGWPFVELGVADFLSRGIDRVFERSTEIFEDLLSLSEAVVLLDEVESVFADRQQQIELLQKLLTAALLPPLQRIQKRGRIILMIATNHIDGFDTAISRPGRIDFVIPVGPPNQAQRTRVLGDIVKLHKETAEVLAGFLRPAITLYELLLFKKLPKPVGKKVGAEEATAYHSAWAAAKRTPVIGDDVMKKFNDDAVKYRRVP